MKIFSNIWEAEEFVTTLPKTIRVGVQYWFQAAHGPILMRADYLVATFTDGRAFAHELSVPRC